MHHEENSRIWVHGDEPATSDRSYAKVKVYPREMGLQQRLLLDIHDSWVVNGMTKLIFTRLKSNGSRCVHYMYLFESSYPSCDEENLLPLRGHYTTDLVPAL
jgi:hypothetical protein